jgi:hypothetical protein
VNWQVAACIAAVAFPLVGLLNAWLLNQVRTEIAAVKLEIAETRAADKEQLKAWAEERFLTKREADTRFAYVEGRHAR